MSLGKSLGKYEILGPLGKGGFGRVWLARSPGDAPDGSQLVAIKQLRREKILLRGPRDQASRYEEAFRSEAELSSHLHHPNIVRMLELLKSGRHYAMVMEFVNGLGLDELLFQVRMKELQFPPDLALEITVQAGSGLHYAHHACAPDGTPLRIVHRDIKPSNIMICRQGRVRLMDFGVARSTLAHSGTTTGTIKGTLRYLSPEQAGGSRDIGPKSDQFALALVLAEMLIGMPVYDAERDHEVLLRALGGNTRAAVTRAEAVCPGVGVVLERALAVSPEDRFPSTGDFVAAVSGVTPPTQTLFGLSEWVHRGLEERAQLAMASPQPPESYGTDSSSGDLDRDADRISDAMGAGVAGASIAHSGIAHSGVSCSRVPLPGAAHREAASSGAPGTARVGARGAASSARSEVMLSGMSAGRRAGAEEDSSGEHGGIEDGAWELLYWDPPSVPNRIDVRRNPDDWVMVPTGPDEQSWKPWRRGVTASAHSVVWRSSTSIQAVPPHQ